MKVTPKQFALSLYESVDDKPAGQVKVVIKKFVELLAKKNMLSKADKIAEQFGKIWNEKNGIIEAEVASAKKLDKETIKILKKYIAETAKVKEVVVKEKVDKGLLGGVVIRYEDKVLDGSLKGSLMDLKSSLEK